MGEARRKEADREFQDWVDRALEQGYEIGRVFEQARVMFFLVKTESHGALAARLAKHLDSEPSRREQETVRAAVADALRDRLPEGVTLPSDAGKDRDAAEREPKPPEPEPESPGNAD